MRWSWKLNPGAISLTTVGAAVAHVLVWRGAARSGNETADPPRMTTWTDPGGKDHEVPIRVATLLKARWRGQKITKAASAIIMFWKGGPLSSRRGWSGRTQLSTT